MVGTYGFVDVVVLMWTVFVILCDLDLDVLEEMGLQTYCVSFQWLIFSDFVAFHKTVNLVLVGWLVLVVSSDFGASG